MSLHRHSLNCRLSPLKSEERSERKKVRAFFVLQTNAAKPRVRPALLERIHHSVHGIGWKARKQSRRSAAAAAEETASCGRPLAALCEPNSDLFSAPFSRFASSSSELPPADLPQTPHAVDQTQTGCLFSCENAPGEEIGDQRSKFLTFLVIVVGGGSVLL